MSKNNTQQTTDSQVYQVVLDGQVIRGTYAEVQKAIADWRENHD